MAKLAFSKLNKIKSIPDEIISTSNGDLTVKQYLPLSDKIELIINVLELSGHEENFFNIVKLDSFYRLEMIRAYTNIAFTEKQLEDTAKLYDAITLNGVWELVESKIPSSEKEYVWDAILEMAEAVTQYNRSMVGMIKALTEDYSALDDEAIKIQKQLNTPEIAALLKHFLPEAGLTD